MDFENNVSTGPLKDEFLTEICVDRFIGDDLKSTAFFLSHAHTDHMLGLKTEDPFMNRIGDPGVHLYCHMLTPIVIGHLWTEYLGGRDGVENLIRTRKIIPLDKDTPVIIKVPAHPSSYSVKLTLLGAGHCPGSVMFLFETPSKRILHTGDCRLSVSNLKDMDHLHFHAGSQVKPIDHLYIDTTFCWNASAPFPLREEALNHAIPHLRSWINKGDRNFVKLFFPARFAHEFILIELHKAFGMKIHVNQHNYEVYQHIPGLCEVTTLNPNTRFHLHCGDNPCVRNKNFLNLRLLARRFAKKSNVDDTSLSFSKTGNTLHVACSMHASLSEVTSMIDYLRPKVVTPLTQPIDTSLEEVESSLRSQCKWNFGYKSYQKVGGSSSSHRHHRAVASTVTKKVESINVHTAHNETSIKEITSVEETDSETEWELTPPSSSRKRSRSGSSSDGDSGWSFKFSPSPPRRDNKNLNH